MQALQSACRQWVWLPQLPQANAHGFGHQAQAHEGQHGQRDAARPRRMGGHGGHQQEHEDAQQSARCACPAGRVHGQGLRVEKLQHDARQQRRQGAEPPRPLALAAVAAISASSTMAVFWLKGLIQRSTA